MIFPIPIQTPNAELYKRKSYFAQPIIISLLITYNAVAQTWTSVLPHAFPPLQK